jgi:hypothetical protein
VGLAYDDEDSVLGEAARTAEVGHNHPEGVNGGLPAEILEKVKEILGLRLWHVVEEFCTQYQVGLVSE